ncbi:MAG: proteasome subunit alpha, partial [Acidobacteriota bacterium]|nr:proteasome subunit alpha [Acidobacteriota bacterium]
MSNYFYVSPEQLTKDRAEFAQKGIARGRSIVGAIFDKGVVLVAENPSASLNKISEVYDRIAFAGVGKYNEFDRLREAGIRWADGTGYTYSRDDVDARALANYYAQYLGDMFTEGQKPLEVEILIAQLGGKLRPTKLYRIAYEGTISDEPHFV